MKPELALIILGVVIMAMLGKKTYDITRGYRNNNAGNIRKSGDKWLGLKGDQNGDKSFFQFVSPVYGLRALMIVLLNYQKIYNLNNINDIISRWAPPTENDTVSYVTHVADSVGVSPFEYIEVYHYLIPLAKAIVKHENGINLYSDSLYREAAELAV